MNKTIAISLLVAITSSIALAESLEETKFWKKEQNYMDEHLKTASDACGVKFTFEWSDKASLRTEVEKTKHSPFGVCSNIVDEVASLCRAGADEKAAVKAKIAGFQCGFANPRTLTLSGKTLVYKGNNVQPNFSDWAKPILEKSL